jgi:hypothetical protein
MGRSSTASPPSASMACSGTAFLCLLMTGVFDHTFSLSLVFAKLTASDVENIIMKWCREDRGIYLPIAITNCNNNDI